MTPDPILQAYFDACRFVRFDWVTPDIQALSLHYLRQPLSLPHAEKLADEAYERFILASSRYQRSSARRHLTHARARLWAALCATNTPASELRRPPPVVSYEQLKTDRAKRKEVSRRRQYKIAYRELEQAQAEFKLLMLAYKERNKACDQALLEHRRAVLGHERELIRVRSRDLGKHVTKATASRSAEARAVYRRAREKRRLARARVDAARVRIARLKGRLRGLAI